MLANQQSCLVMQRTNFLWNTRQQSLNSIRLGPSLGSVAWRRAPNSILTSWIPPVWKSTKLFARQCTSRPMLWFSASVWQSWKFGRIPIVVMMKKRRLPRLCHWTVFAVYGYLRYSKLSKMTKNRKKLIRHSMTRKINRPMATWAIKVMLSHHHRTSQHPELTGKKKNRMQITTMPNTLSKKSTISIVKVTEWRSF